LFTMKASAPWKDEVMVRYVTAQGWILVGTSGGDVWRSRDGGETWADPAWPPLVGYREREPDIQFGTE